MREQILGVIDTLDELVNEAVENGFGSAASSMDEAILNLYDAVHEL